ncbi:MAG: hypothetical protein DI630_01315 [Gordonia sp. (in: high G+C Gram-positive bacteria)]|nr:MAG: hypothetical protein DI630_01315 [Gordonia sp. (in: high G+C Gram-positive bacteria)]
MPEGGDINMGLIRSYTRFSDAELNEIYLQDSTEDVVGFVNDLRDADPTITVNIDKAFEALGLMFDRAGLPVNPVVGQGSMPGDINFSEGIPNYMSPSYVAATRDILAHMTFDTLLESTTIADLTDQRIPPFLNWRNENVDYLRSKFAVMAEFIIRAADLNNHVVLELS